MRGTLTYPPLILMLSTLYAGSYLRVFSGHFSVSLSRKPPAVKAHAAQVPGFV